MKVLVVVSSYPVTEDDIGGVYVKDYVRAIARRCEVRVLHASVEAPGNGAVADTLRLVTGALLSVFGRGAAKRVVTPTSTIGIRGTGLYVESQPERSYVCNCYGEILIAAADDANVTERITSRHHDAPRYVSKGRITPAPFINHTDVELALIEALVGRTPPFSLFDEDYGGARRY